MWLALTVWPPRAFPVDILLPSPLPTDLAEIELTYAGDQPMPAVTLNGSSPMPPVQSYRPFVPILNLSSSLGEARSFGPCQTSTRRLDVGVALEWDGSDNDRCGQRVALHREKFALDLLSYETLRLRGRSNAPVVIALEDAAAGRREDNLPIATVEGPFDLAVPLRTLGRRLDLRMLTALVFSGAGQNRAIQIEEVAFIQGPPVVAEPAGVGFWVWNYREAIRDADSVVAACRGQRCTRVLVQMPSQSDSEETWRAYTMVLGALQKAGIDAWALDGYPEAIQAPHLLADKVRRLFAGLPPGTVAGIQFDIEPYVLPGFLKDEPQLRRYLDCIDILKEVIGGRARLSMVIPFWLAAPTVGGRPLAYAVMDRADEVAVMSYRTDLEEVGKISEDLLRYGDLTGTSVWVAVETTPLPVEQHVVLRRDPHADRADAVVDVDRRLLRWLPVSEVPPGRREWFRVHHRFTVRPERLTFAGRPRIEVAAAVRRLLAATAHRSLAGVMIHDLTGFLSLPD